MTCQLPSETRMPTISADSVYALKLLIVENHQQIKELEIIGHQAQCRSLIHAKATGESLLELKKCLKHGQWENWFNKNISAFSLRTARDYIDIATNWTYLKKKENVADLTLTEARNRLKQKRAKERKTLEKRKSVPAIYELNEQLTAINNQFDHYKVRTTLDRATDKQRKQLGTNLTQAQIKMGELQQQLGQYDCQTAHITSVNSHET